MTPKYYHGYVTANDKQFYWRDILNLMRLRAKSSGVEQVELYIIISTAKPLNWLDDLFLKTIKKAFLQHQEISLKEIQFKDNIGRDFGSFSCFLTAIQQEAKENDYVFFQNRSGYGPFLQDWYKRYIVQFNKFSNVALCGATINGMDHHERSDQSMPHVQTFSFLSQKKILDQLGNSFPAEKETERMNIILNGEIELSQTFLRKGFSITSIEQPEIPITNQFTQQIIDVKHKVEKQHSFFHRSYFRGLRILRLYQMKYFIQFLFFMLK